MLSFELRDEGKENSLVLYYHFDKPSLIKDLVFCELGDRSQNRHTSDSTLNNILSWLWLCSW